MEAPRWSAVPAMRVAGLVLLLAPWVLLGGGSGCLKPVKSGGSWPPSQSCPSSIFLATATVGERIYFFDQPGAALYAHGVDWLGDPAPGSGVSLRGSEFGCMEGGHITGPWDPVSVWETYHLTAGVSIAADKHPMRVKSVHVENYGDGVSIEPWAPCLNGQTQPWLYVHGSHIQDTHDDAIESDGLCSVEIADNLIERTFVAFGFRARESEPYRTGANNVVTIRGNLVRMHSFPNNWSGQPEHNGFWKWEHESRGPQIIVRDNVFLAFDNPPTRAGLFPYLNKVIQCENNMLLFAGSEAEWQAALTSSCDDMGDDGLCDGERLLALSDCYTVITKSDSETEADFLATHWDPLVEAWKAAHTADEE